MFKVILTLMTLTAAMPALAIEAYIVDANNAGERAELATQMCGLDTNNLKEVVVAAPVNVGVGGDHSEVTDFLNKELGTEFGEKSILAQGVKNKTRVAFVNVKYNTDQGDSVINIKDLGIIFYNGVGVDVVKDGKVANSNLAQTTLSQANNESLMFCFATGEAPNIIGVVVNATGTEGSRNEVSISVLQTK